MRLARRLRYERTEHELSFGQRSVLATLYRHGAMTAGALADHEQVRPPSMTKTVGCLLEAGYISRTPSEQDRRQIVVDLTEAGRTLLVADRARRDQWLAERLRSLTPEERDLLARATPLLEGLAST
jgi:DNA-binding MarR family transcriptional regulator